MIRLLIKKAVNKKQLTFFVMSLPWLILDSNVLVNVLELLELFNLMYYVL